MPTHKRTCLGLFSRPNCSLDFCSTDAITPPQLPRRRGKNNREQNFVYQENKAQKIAGDRRAHRDSRTPPAGRQNRSRQFVLAITRQNTGALYLLKCKFIQGFMLPCCKYQIPLKTIEQEWIDFPRGPRPWPRLVAWHYINAKLKTSPSEPYGRFVRCKLFIL